MCLFCGFNIQVIDVYMPDMAGWTHHVVELYDPSEENGTPLSSMLQVSDSSTEEQNTVCVHVCL